MSTMFGNMSTEGIEENTGFGTLPTGAYPGTIIHAYGRRSVKSNGEQGAIGFNIKVKLDNGREYTETLYVTNANLDNFYINKKTGDKTILPNYSIVDNLCYAATGKPLNQQSEEMKVIDIYDFTAKKNMPTEVPVMMDLVDQRIILIINEVAKNKQENNGGKWQATNEEEIVNEISNAYHETTELSGREIRTCLEEGKDFPAKGERLQKWKDKYEGKLVNKFKEVKGNFGAKSGFPSQSNNNNNNTNTSAPKKSLFG